MQRGEPSGAAEGVKSFLLRYSLSRAFEIELVLYAGLLLRKGKEITLKYIIVMVS
jgi:hypothetical protein